MLEILCRLAAALGLIFTLTWFLILIYNLMEYDVSALELIKKLREKDGSE